MPNPSEDARIQHNRRMLLAGQIVREVEDELEEPGGAFIGDELREKLQQKVFDTLECVTVERS